MQKDGCEKRMRIHVRGLRDARTRNRYLAMLGMLQGVISLEASSVSERLLIVFDDRQIASWQLSELALRLRLDTTAQTQTAEFMSRQRMYAMLPVALVAGVSVRRAFFGQSQIADSVLAFEFATLVSVFSGYPPLRKHVKRFAARLKISDERLLVAAALFLAVIRESYLVFAALFLLNYNAYRKRRNTLSAAAKAGEAVARFDTENDEPASVGWYARVASHTGVAIGVAAGIVSGDPILISTLLLAANPRPVLMGTRYGLNYAEVLTHEDCRYIPMHAGMDLYELPAVTELVLLRAPDNGDRIATDLRNYAASRRLHVHVWQASAFAETFPSDPRRKADSKIERIVLIDRRLTPPPIHQRQGHTIYLHGNDDQLLQTLLLGEAVQRSIHRGTVLTAGFNLAMITLTLWGWNARQINNISDVFTIISISGAQFLSVDRDPLSSRQSISALPLMNRRNALT